MALQNQCRLLNLERMEEKSGNLLKYIYTKLTLQMSCQWSVEVHLYVAQALMLFFYSELCRKCWLIEWEVNPSLLFTNPPLGFHKDFKLETALLERYIIDWP